MTRTLTSTTHRPPLILPPLDLGNEALAVYRPISTDPAHFARFRRAAQEKGWDIVIARVPMRKRPVNHPPYFAVIPWCHADGSAGELAVWVDPDPAWCELLARGEAHAWGKSRYEAGVRAVVLAAQEKGDG